MTIDVEKYREVRTKVKWLMILRVTVVTLLLGSLAGLQLYQQRSLLPSIYALIVATYLLTILYAIVFYRIKKFTAFAYVQIIGDALFETGVVYATGGLDSAFSFTYIISIIAASFILFRRGGFIVATLSGALYGTLAALQYYGVILDPPMKGISQSELYYGIFLYFFAFYTVALLASSLSERQKVTREALEEKSKDLQELQTLNDSIVRSMADGLVTVDLDGRINGFNKAAESITSLLFEDVRGRQFAEVFEWLGVETFMEDMAGADSHPSRYEIYFKKSKKPLTLGMTVSPLRNERGDAAGLLGIFQDLTPIKKMEQEMKRKDRLAAIGELSAGMAHEIRNPLASLSGALQVLKEEPELSDDNKNLMDIALSEMDRLNDILTDFLTFARPRPTAREACDLSSIIRETTQLITVSKDFRDGITLEFDLPVVPVVASVDPGQFRQALLNLALNAVQSIPDDGTVTVRAYPDGKGNAVVEVEDDGEGIGKPDIDKIFIPFYSNKEGGAGLGLAMVYRIVEEHGGAIKVDSERGKGSRFTVTLPMEGA